MFVCGIIDRGHERGTGMIHLDYREAGQGDLSELLDLYNHYIHGTTVIFDYGKIDIEEFCKRIYIDHPLYKTFLILADNVLAGFYFLTQFRKKPAYDKTVEIGVYLKSEYKRQGLGLEIVSRAEAVARESRFDVIIASISGENRASIGLFKKAGYKQCAHYRAVAEKFGRKHDIIDFQKIL